MGTREYLLDKAKNKGLEKGLEKGLLRGRLEERARAQAEQLAKQRSFVRNLINQTDFSNGEIAGIAEVSIAVVEDVRHELNKK